MCDRLKKEYDEALVTVSRSSDSSDDVTAERTGASGWGSTANSSPDATSGSRGHGRKRKSHVLGKRVKTRRSGEQGKFDVRGPVAGNEARERTTSYIVRAM